jgi:hypothetical protein
LSIFRTFAPPRSDPQTPPCSSLHCAETCNTATTKNFSFIKPSTAIPFPVSNATKTDPFGRIYSRGKIKKFPLLLVVRQPCNRPAQRTRSHQFGLGQFYWHLGPPPKGIALARQTTEHAACQRCLRGHRTQPSAGRYNFSDAAFKALGEGRDLPPLTFKRERDLQEQTSRSTPMQAYPNRWSMPAAGFRILART